MTSRSPVRSGRHTWSHPVLAVLAALLIPALWILFVGSSNRHELLVGLAASLASIVFLFYVARSSGVEVELRPQDIIQLWRIPWYIVSGVYEISIIVFRDLLGLGRARSLYRVCGFDSSTRDPVRKARTILAVAYTTTAPNFIVIGVDPSQSRMLFHQIEASTIPRMTKALGAKS